jgi:hypothetical protein
MQELGPRVPHLFYPKGGSTSLPVSQSFYYLIPVILKKFAGQYLSQDTKMNEEDVTMAVATGEARSPET